MKKLDKRILDSQIEVFCEWGRRFNRSGGYSNYYRPYLELFALHTFKTDILDVEDSDVEEFIANSIDERIRKYPHVKDNARKGINMMRRFYAARGKNGNARQVPGRPPHISEIAQVQEYRKMRDSKGKPMSLKEISRLMGNKSLSLIHRWIKYPLNREGD